MGFRFRRKLSLFRSFNVNLSKSGVGLSFGIRGVRLGINKCGPYFSFGMPGTGLYYYQKIKQNKISDSGKGWNIVKQGIDFFEKGNYKNAVNYFNEYLKLNPNDFEIRYLLGFAYFKQAKYSEAIKEVSVIPEGNEFFDESLAIKAFCLQDLDDNNESEKLLNKVIPLLKGFVLKEAYFCMAEIYESRGDYKIANEWYKKYAEVKL